jgi:hypothetical protein
MRLGSVAEWSIAPVLKTGNPKGFVSSNLTASAKLKPQVSHLLEVFLLFVVFLCVPFTHDKFQRSSLTQFHIQPGRLHVCYLIPRQLPAASLNYLRKINFL